MLRESTYTEVLQVVHGDGVAEEVQQSILEHAAVTVAVEGRLLGVVFSWGAPSSSTRAKIFLWWVSSGETQAGTYERTKRSRLAQSGFLGLKFMNLLNRTWATGAIPIGAPGWPELALEVASTWRPR